MRWGIYIIMLVSRLPYVTCILCNPVNVHNTLSIPVSSLFDLLHSITIWPGCTLSAPGHYLCDIRSHCLRKVTDRLIWVYTEYARTCVRVHVRTSVSSYCCSITLINNLASACAIGVVRKWTLKICKQQSFRRACKSEQLCWVLRYCTDAQAHLKPCCLHIWIC